MKMTLPYSIHLWPRSMSPFGSWGDRLVLLMMMKSWMKKVSPKLGSNVGESHWIIWITTWGKPEIGSFAGGFITTTICSLTSNCTLVRGMKLYETIPFQFGKLKWIDQISWLTSPLEPHFYKWAWQEHLGETRTINHRKIRLSPKMFHVFPNCPNVRTTTEDPTA